MLEQIEQVSTNPIKKNQRFDQSGFSISMTSTDRLGAIQINFDHHIDTTISKTEFDIVTVHAISRLAFSSFERT